METPKTRCPWCNLKNPVYIRYHDEEWGVPLHDDQRLYELLILESFQAGLSWECVLNKRESFRKAFDCFDINRVCLYNEEKLNELMTNPGIIRNRRKLVAAVENSRIFRSVQQQYGSFDRYLWSFTEGKTLRQEDMAVTKSSLSDAISCDLYSRGMRFVGSTIIYSYLQAAGLINAHSPDCFRAPENR